MTIFAAASLKNAVDELSKKFKQETGKEIRLNFASSGRLAQQIAAGAPADIFLSANLDWVDYLVEKKLLIASDTFPFCMNKLVMIAPATSDLNEIKIDPATRIADLFSGRLAIGDPTHVPGGKYAYEFLENIGWLDCLKDRLLPCISIREVLILIEMNEWQLGIVFYSDFVASKKVRKLAEIPEKYHSKILYSCAVLKKSELSELFCEFLNTDQARKVLIKNGFSPILDRENGEK
ncbi:MAG: molybdate ABC transporter substrate-binding protein [Candidatus Rifleibacteriota bacterium]